MIAPRLDWSVPLSAMIKNAPVNSTLLVVELCDRSHATVATWNGVEFATDQQVDENWNSDQ